MLKLEWDEQKRLSNLKKHGFDFNDAEILFEGLVYTVEDTRFSYGEQRFLSFGLIEGRVVAVAHTEEDDVIRIISMRKANKNEQERYFKEIAD